MHALLEIGGGYNWANKMAANYGPVVHESMFIEMCSVIVGSDLRCSNICLVEEVSLVTFTFAFLPDKLEFAQEMFAFKGLVKSSLYMSERIALTACSHEPWHLDDLGPSCPLQAWTVVVGRA